MSESLVEYLKSQQNLLQEASEALPHQFSHCTYALGHIRQAVYLCKTCPEPRGICSACSIACHTDHEQIELFPKRNFRCDCPTESIVHPCRLHATKEQANASNGYGQNFEGTFCRCGRPYDPNAERETMIQCLACEDWFHESCCNLRERPLSREATPTVDQADSGDDARSEASSSGLPPPLLGGDQYDAFVCSACVLGIPILQKFAGTPGCLMVIRESLSNTWRVVPSDDDKVPEVSADENPEPEAKGQKRGASPSELNAQDLKRRRLSPSTSGPCLAPPPNTLSQKVFEDLRNGGHSVCGSGDVFLTDGFRKRWCHCPACAPSLHENPFLLEEEETYEPPDDPDSGLSLEELGMRALSRLPRERAIDGIHAFNSMREDLVQFLRPFAEGGKVVAEADVQNFFDALKEKQQKQAGGE